MTIPYNLPPGVSISDLDRDAETLDEIEERLSRQDDDRHERRKDDEVMERMPHN